MLYCGHMKSERHWLEIRGTKVRTKLAENVAAVSQYLPRTCALFRMLIYKSEEAAMYLVLRSTRTSCTE